MSHSGFGQAMWSPLSINHAVVGCTLPKLPEKSGINRPHQDVLRSAPTTAALLHKINANSHIFTSVDVGLKFGEDVLAERCSHLLPYSINSLQKALNRTELSQSRSKAIRPKRTSLRHLTQAPPRFSYLKATYDEKYHDPTSGMRSLDHISLQSDIKTGKNSVGRIKSVTSSNVAHHKQHVETVEWDEYLVNVLSAETARWVVHHRSTDEETRGRLESTLNALYGPMEEEYPELVRDDVSDVNVPVDSNQKKSAERNWQSQQDVLEDRVKELTSACETSDVNDMNTALSRLPAVVDMSYETQSSDVVYNATAQNVKVVPVTYPAPATLKDILNPRVGNTVFETSNRFQQEALVGSKPVHQPNKNRIVMDSSTVYRKHIQRRGPQSPESMLQLEQRDQTIDSGAASSGKPERGGNRWVALPEYIEDTSVTIQSLFDESSGKTVTRDSPMFATLIDILNEWRSLWQLDMCYDKTTPDNLIRDMADIHVDVKLRAIVTCARVTEYGDQSPGGAPQMTSLVKLLPERLYVALECCLEDTHDRVRRAAAIALYILNRPSEQAELILSLAVDDANCVDHWTAVRCLAYYGECNCQIVSTIMNELFTSCNETRRRQATNHLIELSKYSTLVHSMLGERLNSSSWMDRLIACKMLCHLRGQCSNDLVSKLLSLMWNDWQSEVRETAMTALVCSGHGLAVHDSLLKKITGETIATKRANAICKIGQLGLMTAKMLIIFLKCFDDDNSTVRYETCVASSRLSIRDERLLTKLVTLVKEDPVTKVKVAALQALTVIGITTPVIHNAILWAFRFESDPTVRSEACHTAYCLHLRGDDVVSTMQERFLVETSESVKSEIRAALAQLGVSPTEDMPMVVQIKKEVRQLCDGHIVRAQILKNELEEAQRDASKRLIKKNTVGAAQNGKATKSKKDNSGRSSIESRDQHATSLIPSRQSSAVDLRSKVLPNINNDLLTLNVCDIPVDGETRDNIPVNGISEENSQVTGDARDNIPDTGDGQENSKVPDDGIENTLVRSSSENLIPVMDAAEDHTRLTGVLEDNCLLRNGSRDKIPVIDCNEDNTLVIAPIEKDDAVVSSSGNNILVTDGRDLTRVVGGEAGNVSARSGSVNSHRGSACSRNDTSLIDINMQPLQQPFNPLVHRCGVKQVQSPQPEELIEGDGVDVASFLPHDDGHTNDQAFSVASPAAEPAIMVTNEEPFVAVVNDTDLYKHRSPFDEIARRASDLDSASGRPVSRIASDETAGHDISASLGTRQTCSTNAKSRPETADVLGGANNYRITDVETDVVGGRGGSRNLVLDTTKAVDYNEAVETNSEEPRQTSTKMQDLQILELSMIKPNQAPVEDPNDSLSFVSDDNSIIF